MSASLFKTESQTLVHSNDEKDTITHEDDGSEAVSCCSPFAVVAIALHC